MNISQRVFSVVILLALLVGSLPARNLQVGDDAPDFTLAYASPDTINFDGIRLSDYRGKQNVILAFYPADWSPGCTTEMCNLRDNFAALAQLNAAILGISGDYVFSHKAWIDHHGIQFKLLSDHLHKVARMYQSYRPTLGMNKRTVFIINKEGKIAYINMEYTAGDQQDFQELQQQLAALGN